MNYIQLLRTYPRYIGYGALHYFFSGPGQSFFLALFAGYFISAAGIDQVGFDWIYSGATLMSAFVLPMLGQLLDRIKLRYFSVGVGLAFTFFCIVAAWVNHPVYLFLVLFGLRLCGQGLMPLTASTAIARYFEETRGKALSLISFGVSASEILMPILIIFMLGLVGWQASWWLIGASVLVIFIPSVIFLIPSGNPFQFNPEQSSADSPIKGSITRGQVLRDWRFYPLLMEYLFVPFFFTGLVINKDLLREAYGWSEAHLALGFSVFGATRLVASLFSGPLIDRFTAIRIFAFMLIPIGLGIAGFLVSTHVAVLIFFFMMGGISASLSSLTATAAWAELYGIGHLGAIRSMVTTFMTFSTAIAPVILGWGMATADRISTTFSLSVLVVIGLTFGAFWVIRKLKPISDAADSNSAPS